ncbi:MAG: hypothetical protein K9M56_03295 [Victivallales bacterium]|nr:hypothetical protein [Victivallales bacterium]
MVHLRKTLLIIFGALLLSSNCPAYNASIKAHSGAVWYDAKTVLVHPPGLEDFFISIFPVVSGFKGVFNREEAFNEIVLLADKLKSLGVKVLTTKEVLFSKTVDSSGMTVSGNSLSELQYFAEDFLKIQFSNSNAPLSLNLQNYKNHIISNLSPQDLVNLIFLNPTILIKREQNHITADNKLSPKFIINPISSFLYMNDLAINTRKGIIVGKLSNPQRKKETEVFKFLLNFLDIDPVYELKSNAKLEGSDFISADEVCFVGQGIRTNNAAVKQLTKERVLDTDKIIVVKDRLKRPSEMHLKKYFNMLNKNTVVFAQERMNEENPTKADVYEMDFNKGQYILTEKDAIFTDYIQKELNYKIIPVSKEDIDNLATDYFLVRSNLIIAVDGVSNKYKEALRNAGVKAIWLDINNIKSGGGGIDSVIQVLERKNTKEKPKLGMHL